MLQKQNKYTGILNEPIKYKGAGHYLFQDNDKAFELDFAKQHIEREKALYGHYDLPYDPINFGHLLAMKLAQNHVSGFSFNTGEKRKLGRPNKWLGKKAFIFYLKIQIKLQQKQGCSIREAIGHVAKDMNMDILRIY